MFRRLATLMARRLTTVQQLEAEHRRSSQYERWFQASVRQVRTLDCERQKFVALANSAETAVFVADRDGVVRWCSRRLLEQFPGPGPKNSWVTMPCAALCHHIHGREPDACHECVVQRIVDEERSDLAVSAVESPGGNSLEITARPIRDVKGKAVEVIVVLKSDHEARRAA